MSSETRSSEPSSRGDRRDRVGGGFRLALRVAGGRRSGPAFLASRRRCKPSRNGEGRREEFKRKFSRQGRRLPSEWVSLSRDRPSIGLTTHGSTLPIIGWHDVPSSGLCESALALPVFVENGAKKRWDRWRCGFGAGRGHASHRDHPWGTGVGRHLHPMELSTGRPRPAPGVGPQLAFIAGGKAAAAAEARVSRGLHRGRAVARRLARGGPAGLPSSDPDEEGGPTAFLQGGGVGALPLPHPRKRRTATEGGRRQPSPTVQSRADR